MLSSFSPLGSSKIRDFHEADGHYSQPRPHQPLPSVSNLLHSPTVSVAQIQPRTSTPIQASGMSQTVVAADAPSPDKRALAAETLATPSSSSNAARVPGTTEGLKRLSISGRLSYGAQGTPAPLSLVAPAETTTERLDRLRDRFGSPTAGGPSSSSAGARQAPLDESSREGASGGSFRIYSNSTTTNANAKASDPVLEKYSLSLTDKPTGARSSLSTTLTSTGGLSSAAAPVGGQSSLALPEMIRGFIESSLASYMQEIRNDVQNLHVELIKQSLSQQTSLRQILTSLPESYNRLAQENQSLREEIERLRLRLGQL